MDSRPPVDDWASWKGSEQRRRFRKYCAAKQLPCCICGAPINYQLRYPNPYSFSVQHVEARANHPELTWVKTNWDAAHLVCNKRAGTGTPPTQTIDYTDALGTNPPPKRR